MTKQEQRLRRFTREFLIGVIVDELNSTGLLKEIWDLCDEPEECAIIEDELRKIIKCLEPEKLLQIGARAEK